MKNKSIQVVAFLMILKMVFLLVCYAESSFEYENVSEQEAITIIENTDMQIHKDCSYDGKFTSFGASSNGNYAIAYSKGYQSNILIYDEYGTSIVGFSFKNGGSFYIDLFDESLTIYIVRSRVAITIDYFGNCLSTRSIPKTKANNKRWNELDTNVLECGNYNYLAKGSFSGYSKLIRISKEGEQVILYESSIIGKTATVFPVVILVVFPFAFVFLLVYMIRKARKT